MNVYLKFNLHILRVCFSLKSPGYCTERGCGFNVIMVKMSKTLKQHYVLLVH